MAAMAVRHIAALYAIESNVRGQSPDARLAAGRQLSAPIVEALKPWFEKQLSLISSGFTLAGDVRCALSHWAGLTRFLEDGRLELDTNPVENAIRPVALTRKNALFVGHEVGAENWRLSHPSSRRALNDVNPVAYITATLQAILDGHPQNRIEELMPWRFQCRAFAGEPGDGDPQQCGQTSGLFQNRRRYDGATEGGGLTDRCASDASRPRTPGSAGQAMVYHPSITLRTTIATLSACNIYGKPSFLGALERTRTSTAFTTGT
jgi:hypothetical protein